MAPGDEHSMAPRPWTAVRVRPRRSVLYVPASNERALAKAATLPVDGLILDLEDAVAREAKPAARDRACAAVASRAYGWRELVIRVNAAGTPWHDADLQAVCAAAPDAVLVPKAGSGEEVASVAEAMDAAGAPACVALWVMVETPLAVLASAAIGSASGRVAVLVFGANDLAKELGVPDAAGRGPLRTALSLTVLGARAAGVGVLDGVYNDVRDPAGFDEEAREGRALGFDGKTLIHPNQVEAANHAFSPDAEEVETARRTVAAYEAAEAQGHAVATLDGRLVERLHADSARRVLALEEAVAARAVAHQREAAAATRSATSSPSSTG